MLAKIMELNQRLERSASVNKLSIDQFSLAAEVRDVEQMEKLRVEIHEHVDMLLDIYDEIGRLKSDNEARMLDLLRKQGK